MENPAPLPLSSHDAMCKIENFTKLLKSSSFKPHRDASKTFLFIIFLPPPPSDVALTVKFSLHSYKSAGVEISPEMVFGTFTVLEMHPLMLLFVIDNPEVATCTRMEREEKSG